MYSIKDFKAKYRDKGGFKTALYDIKKKLYIEKNSFKGWKGLFKLASKHNFIDDIEFFKSREDKIIFSLTKLEGEFRANMLGIEPEMYSNLEKSKKWYREIVSELHPDRCNHPSATEATSILNNIYKKMKKYAK